LENIKILDIGDFNKVRKKLHWQPTVSLKKLIQMMVDVDLEGLKHGLERPLRTNENVR
jgi:GDP-D-mannose dehydratase